MEIDQDWAWEGIYKVVDDSHKDLIHFFNERFIVTGTQDEREFSAEFVIAVGRDCRCHVRKVSGPETILLE